ncbi:MAG TPA: O-antigen ligase family protein, partial [Bacteroidia bacterium]|nr:O-antigen ligase family protein [Bacteroidia bacterium]
MINELKIEKEGMIAQTRDKNVTFLIFLSIFLGSSILLFKTPFEGYFHYVIYVLLLPFFVGRFGLPKTPFKILMVPLVVGLFQILLGNNEIFLFIKIWGGVLLSVSFYYYVMEYFELNVEKMFKLYLTWAYWSAIIGIIQYVSFRAHFFYGYDYGFLLNKGGHVITENGEGIRISSIFLEPSQLGIMLAPATFVALYNIFRRKGFHYKMYQNIVILIALYLSRSSTGYLGIFLAVLIIGMNFGYLLYVVLFVVLGYFAAAGLYNTVDEFKERVDSSVALWVQDDLAYENVNSSSFVLYNNAHIAWSNLKEHPVFGTGLGSHPIAYEKFSYTKSLVQVKGIEFNKQDANSMFFRIMSETGIFGMVLVFVLIFKCFVGYNGDEEDNHWII